MSVRWGVRRQPGPLHRPRTHHDDYPGAGTAWVPTPSRTRARTSRRQESSASPSRAERLLDGETGNRASARDPPGRRTRARPRRARGAPRRVRRPTRSTPRSTDTPRGGSVVLPRSGHERRIREKLANWRTLLAADVEAGRQVLRQLLVEPFRFTPVTDGRRRGYEFTGTLALDRVVSGVVELPLTLTGVNSPRRKRRTHVVSRPRTLGNRGH
jgi:hypothetical protein